MLAETRMDRSRTCRACPSLSCGPCRARATGLRIGQAELVAFVGALDIGDAAKQRLLELTPAGYTGLADELVDRLPRA